MSQAAQPTFEDFYKSLGDSGYSITALFECYKIFMKDPEIELVTFMQMPEIYKYLRIERLNPNNFFSIVVFHKKD